MLLFHERAACTYQVCVPSSQYKHSYYNYVKLNLADVHFMFLLGPRWFAMPIILAGLYWMPGEGELSCRATMIT